MAVAITDLDDKNAKKMHYIYNTMRQSFGTDFFKWLFLLRWFK